ncbi:MAG: isopentenyl phosphate kinase [Anaerolineaceae bacterium]
MNTLIFLKLGGSLITQKNRAHTVRRAVLARLAAEIAAAHARCPQLQLVLGHGSGSFGHTAAKKYGTRQGVQGETGWQGFVEVWREARDLNNTVLAALREVNLPVLAVPPSACAVCENGRILSWDTGALQSTINAGLIPLVYGDVAFDQTLGGTIVSTEDVFFHLAAVLHPKRILLAGREEGVWEDYPRDTRLIPLITPDNLPQITAALQGSAAVDVTGGMEDKVRRMVALVQQIPELEVQIFSGIQPENVTQSLLGENFGTVIRS